MKPWIAVCGRLLRTLASEPKPYWKSMRTYAEHELEEAEADLHLFEPFHQTEGLRMLDVGCGMGGKSVWYALSGAREVVGVDPDAARIEEARRFARDKGVNAKCRFHSWAVSDMADEGAQFDVVILSDVFEHVFDPRSVLKACWKLVAPGGQLRIKFPPYRSPYGGHCAMIRLPWAHLLFPEEALLVAIKERYAHLMISSRLASLSRSLEEIRAARSIRELGQVNGLSIAAFEEMMNLIDVSPSLYRLVPVRGLPLASRLPVLRECLVSRIVTVWHRPATPLE